MSITRDRINHGKRLPKIMLGEVFSLGIKSVFVYGFYLFVQFAVMIVMSMMFDFPIFNLEEMLLNLDDTVHMFLVNEIWYSLKFVVFGGLAFYITTFFVEIGLARLADTKSLLSAFNFASLYRSIKLIGLKAYVFECTSIILAIIVLSYLKYVSFTDFWFNHLWSTFLGFLIFATQYLGIGAVYANIKDKELERRQSDNDS